MEQHFSLFRLPETYNIDVAALKQTHHQLLTQFHPDQFAAASQFEQKQALMMTAALNEAYRILSHPLDRAAYLLKKQGIDADAPEHTHFSADFLMQQMAWREAVMDARMEKNHEALQSLEKTIAQEQNELYQAIQAAFDAENSEKIAELIRKGRFLAKLMQEIQEISF